MADSEDDAWPEGFTERALAIWEEYQKTHDVSALEGLAVGIDPVGGGVWFGESAVEIVEQMNAQGGYRPFYCTRVGSDYYWIKGGH
ncbi:MAG: hypothetical protein HY721_20585 [Planctomycetes bacterium]|nr:hypothetical protein [Planctomycetota bacterium]